VSLRRVSGIPGQDHTTSALSTPRTCPEIDFRRKPSRARSQGLEAAKAETDKVKAAQSRIAAERYDLPIDAASKALENHTTFRSAMSTPNDKGVLLLSLITRQAHLAATLGTNGYLLVLKANMLGGTAYTKKNFWTFFGSMPYTVTGGHNGKLHTHRWQDLQHHRLGCGRTRRAIRQGSQDHRTLRAWNAD